MNNAKIVFDNLEEETNDRIMFLEKKRGELSQVAEVINVVEASQDWQKLKRLVLDDVLASLEHQLHAEASKDQVDIANLYRLQGQLAWARKYADLKKLSEFFKQQIESIKFQIHEQKNTGDGAP